MGLTRACCWLALSSLIAAEAQTAATTTQATAATASFAYMSEDGCVQSEVVVFANTRTPGSSKAPSPAAEVTYSRHRYDYCENADLGTDLGASSRPMFSGDLNRASLDATIYGHTASGSAVTVSFALVWEGKGAIARQAGRPQNAPTAAAKPIRGENLSRGAVVSGTMDGEDVSGATVAAGLHTTRITIPAR